MFVCTRGEEVAHKFLQAISRNFCLCCRLQKNSAATDGGTGLFTATAQGVTEMTQTNQL